MINALRALLAIILFWVCTSWGHEGRPVYVEVQQQAVDSYRLKWKIPPVMPAGEEPLISLIGSACESRLPIANRLDGGLGGIDQLPQPRRTGLIGRLDYRCAANVTDLAVNIAYPRTNPALTSLVIFSPLQANPKQIFSSPERVTVPLLADISGGEVARQFTQAGIKHILSGYDHLAFVLCLMMIAGNIRRLLLTVSGFTLAHSVTLSLATLDWVRLPSVLVETLIALSILLLAVELHRHILGRRADISGDLDLHADVIEGIDSRVVQSPKSFDEALLEHNAPSFTWRYPILTAALFGLLHGFGFASVLQDLGLPDDLAVPALLFFNLGVELGQLAFIALVLVLVTIAWRGSSTLQAHSRHAQGLVIYALGGTSALWLIERLAAW